jgi:hypothetical protein
VVNFAVVEHTYVKLVGMFTCTLGAYHTLRSLKLVHFTIDAPFRETLAALARLEELHLTSCEILGRKGAQLPLQHIPLERTSRRAGAHEAYNEPLDIVSPETLHALHIDDSRDSVALLLILVKKPLILTEFVTLSVRVSDSTAAVFLAILERCPQLKRVDFRSPSPMDLSTLFLPPRSPF